MLGITELLDVLSFQKEDIQSYTIEKQNEDYGGILITTKDTTYRIRVAKQTPKKTGQFLALWEKDGKNQNRAYRYDDFPDYLIIVCHSEEAIGLFQFSKQTLKEKGILKTNNQKGKMGFRVYPSWDVPQNSQAMKTQAWQMLFFIYYKNKRY